MNLTNGMFFDTNGTLIDLLMLADGWFTIDINVPPTPDPTPLPDFVTITVGEALNYTVTFVDQDGDNLTLTAKNLPYGSSFTDYGDGTGSFIFTPIPSQEGKYMIIFDAKDNGHPPLTISGVLTVIVIGVGVGGIIIPVDKPALLAPWIFLAIAVAVAAVSVAVYRRKYRGF